MLFLNPSLDFAHLCSIYKKNPQQLHLQLYQNTYYHPTSAPLGKQASRTEVSIQPAPPLKQDVHVSPAIANLNKERQAVAIKEFDAYGKQHGRIVQEHTITRRDIVGPVTPPSPPRDHDSALGPVEPSEDEGVTNTITDTELQKQEVAQWMKEFRDNTQDGIDPEVVLEVLVALNESMETASSELKTVFYAASDEEGFISILENLGNRLMSTRVMKEIEEFIDAREDWKDERD